MATITTSQNSNICINKKANKVMEAFWGVPK